jgi:ArsR family transcriptional regulator
MDTKPALRMLAALAQDTRLAIFRYLVERAPDGAFAGDVAERLAVPAATLSFHLKELSHAELIVGTQEGRHVRYTADLAAVQALVGYLTDTCCGGDPSRCAPVAVPLPTPSRKRRAS